MANIHESQKFSEKVTCSSNLLANVHSTLRPPTTGKTFMVRGSYKYYHYGCDGFNDHGWGCAYRTIQTICSWILGQQSKNEDVIPSIKEIQQILADLECRPSNFVGSNAWIGAIEACFVFDKLYGTCCRILHKAAGISEFSSSDIKKLIDYFETFGGICIMGGDRDASSKGIAGIHIGEDNDVFLLVIDPHCRTQPKDAEQLISEGYVRWQHLKDFNEFSFYNICMPEHKGLMNLY